jgi:hypothetical protein
VKPNRVAGGSSPPAPTAPRMAGPHGTLPPDGKGHRKMTASNAGYGTSRQDRFTRSGAVRSLRRAPLSGCRRFGPLPCPTHYGERLATMPSADFCPITPSVIATRTFALELPSEIPSQVCPCRRLVVVVVHHVDITGTPTGDFYPISSCPCRAYTRQFSEPCMRSAADFITHLNLNGW